MATKISYNGFRIFTNQIINTESFLNLYKKEKISTELKTKITTYSHHPFATFLAEERHKAKINQCDLLVMRICKDNMKFEFISKICRWGKFSIPKEAIFELNIKNHDLIVFEVVKKAKPLENTDKNFIDISKTANTKAIFRENGFITLFQEGRTPITLPRLIEITPELIELFYLIHGDGHYQYKLYFVNKSPELHQFVMSKFDEILKIPLDFWRVRLLFNNSSSKDKAKDKWKSILNLGEEQFYPTISKTVLNTSEDGNLRIVIETPVVSEIFKNIFSKLQHLNKIESLHALNGLLCAEGGARKNKQGLHKITLSFSQKEKDMFQGIINNAGIGNYAKISQNSRFVISSWEHLYYFFKLFLSNNIIPFSIHPQRKDNAITGFLEHSFTKTAHKYLKILSTKPELTTNELIAETGYLPNSILNTLRRKQYSGFVSIKGAGINRNPFHISITPKGTEFINLVEGLKLHQHG